MTCGREQTFSKTNCTVVKRSWEAATPVGFEPILLRLSEQDAFICE